MHKGCNNTNVNILALTSSTSTNNCNTTHSCHLNFKACVSLVSVQLLPSIGIAKY